MNRIILNIAVLIAGALLAGLLATHFAGASDNRPTSRPASSFDPKFGTNRMEHLARTFNGEDWSLTSFTSTLGEVCAGISVPGHGLGVGCIDPSLEFGNSPLSLHAGGAKAVDASDHTRWSYEWVWGRVQTNVVDKVRLTLTDCTQIGLLTDSTGYFMYVLGPGQIASNVGPMNVTVLRGDGSVIDTQDATVAAPHKPHETVQPKVVSC